MCDRDKLMKLCDTKIENMHFVNSDHWFDFSQKIEELVDYLISNGVTVTNVGCKSEWISVEERFPETEGDYLVWNKAQKRIEIRFFYRLPPHYPVESHPEIREYFGNFADYKIITHWMPLPEAPKGGAE